MSTDSDVVTAVLAPGAADGGTPVTQAFTAGGDRAPKAPAATPALTSPPTSRSGTMLRHFRIDRRLAGGGMGEVFLGYDTSLSRPVAIKTIHPALAQDRAFLARFVREATAQANVVHPHVVQVYFVGEDAGQWFLAMQLVDGGSLHDGLARGKKMRWQDAARNMSSICEGLVVAERLGIVHRDIKPANILLDRDGRALLSDFGLAASTTAPRGAAAVVDVDAAIGALERKAGRVKPPASSAPDDVPHSSPSGRGSQLQLASVTQVGVVMGTPEYVAPEQLKAGPVDARADMYALAATFFHLVSGTPVMPVDNLGKAIDRYAQGHRAPRLRTLAPAVPHAFAAVIDRCLERDPADRFKSIAALRDALARVMPQPEVRASAPLRVLVWLLDVAPFIALSVATYARWPWLGPLLFFVAGALGIAALGSSPGIWLMRLRLRTVDDGDVSFARGFARFLIQHGWYVPLALGWSALYGDSNFDVFLIVGAAWFGLTAAGAVGALFGRGQALHDLMTRTRVLVDVRFR